MRQSSFFACKVFQGRHFVPVGMCFSNPEWMSGHGLGCNTLRSNEGDRH